MITVEKTLKVPNLRFPEYEEEWKKTYLEKVGTFFKGNTLSKADLSDTGHSCILYGELYTKYGETIKKVESKTESKAKNLFTSKQGDVLIPSSGESAEDIATASAINVDNVILGGDINVFRPADFISGSYISYLIKAKGRKQLQKLAQGATVVHLYSSNLKRFNIHVPILEEQRKIVNFFTVLDEQIEFQKEKVHALKERKKAIMQKIFRQELRFNDNNDQAFPDWKERSLSEILYHSKNRNSNLKFGKEQVLSVSGEYGIVNQISLLGRSYAGVSVAEYHVVEKGDIVYTKSPLKANPYGIIKVNEGEAGIVSTLYAVYSCKEGYNGKYIDYYFQTGDYLNRYLKPLVNKGAKNDMKVNNEAVLAGTLIVPEIKEQEKIVSFLTLLDEEINLEKELLLAYQEEKKAFMQQMFI